MGRVTATITPEWLEEWMAGRGVVLWGAADLDDFQTPADASGHALRYAISFAIPVNPQIMVLVQDGPTHDYAGEYARINKRINEVSGDLAAALRHMGFHALPLAASERTDAINIMGDFPHKTAATRAGLGWIGKHCQLVTRRYGSWVRLGTVFTDCELACNNPMDRSFCGKCNKCVEACPAQAIRGASWEAGMAREELLDFRGCDEWKTSHYSEYLNGRACGICSAVCPYGLKTVEKKPGK